MSCRVVFSSACGLMRWQIMLSVSKDGANQNRLLSLRPETQCGCGQAYSADAGGALAVIPISYERTIGVSLGVFVANLILDRRAGTSGHSFRTPPSLMAKDEGHGFDDAREF